MINPTSAIPQKLNLCEQLSIFRHDNVTWSWGKWARAAMYLKRRKKKFQQLYPWAALTKMTLGAEDYGLIYNNQWRRRENGWKTPEVDSGNTPSSSPGHLMIFRPASAPQTSSDRLMNISFLVIPAFIPFPSPSSSPFPDNLFIRKCHITFVEQLGGPLWIRAPSVITQTHISLRLLKSFDLNHLHNHLKECWWERGGLQTGFPPAPGHVLSLGATLSRTHFCLWSVRTRRSDDGYLQSWRELVSNVTSGQMWCKQV